MPADPQWDEPGGQDSPGRGSFGKKSPAVEKCPKMSMASGCFLLLHEVSLVPSALPFPPSGTSGIDGPFPARPLICKPGQGEVGLQSHSGQETSSLHTHPSPP